MRLLKTFWNYAGRSWVRCTHFNKELQCRNDSITALKRHNKRQVRKQREAAVEIQTNDRRKLSALSQELSSKTMSARKAEIMMTILLAHHNSPISLNYDFLTFIRTIDVDINVQQEATSNATKCTAIL